MTVKTAILNTHAAQCVTVLCALVAVVLGDLNWRNENYFGVAVETVLFFIQFALFQWQGRIRARLRGMQ